MIGPIASTPDPRRVARRAVPAAIAALIGLAAWAGTGATSTLMAQAPAPTRVRARPTGVEIPPPTTDGPEARAPRDGAVRPASFDDDKDPLGPAIMPTGGVPAAAGPGQTLAADPFALPVDKMGLGKQRMMLSVEVQADRIINLGKESTVRLVVKNESSVDASGISLIYEVPESLDILSSTPPATPVPSDKRRLQLWRKEMLGGNGEWTVVLRVVAKSNKPCEHGATVTAKTGSRANSIVQEPKLKVEATAMPGRTLKGEQITFHISVINTGTGPARNVTVQAKLSSGLRSPSGDDLVEQTITEIPAGHRLDLEDLTVDTVAGGQQTCTIDARSPDVTAVPDDQRITRNVEVTKPELAVKLEAAADRFTGQSNDYKLTVTNPGTAPARNVKVVATMPTAGGKLLAKPPGARWDDKTRKLIWSIAQLEPFQTMEMGFTYGTSTPGLYKATAEATSGELRAIETMTTEVSGIAVLDVQVTQTTRVMDVGKTNYYDITVKNSGTKEATRLQLSGKLTKNLKVLKHFNVEKGEFKFNPDEGDFIFPEVERLGVGQTITLSLEVQATESGPGRLPRQARPRRDDGPERPGRGRHLHHRHRQQVPRLRRQAVNGPTA